MNLRYVTAMARCCKSHFCWVSFKIVLDFALFRDVDIFTIPRKRRVIT